MKNVFLLVLFTFIFPLHAQRADFNTIDFEKADHIASIYKGEELTNLPALTYKLTSQLETDVERFRAIYYWVTHNIAGEYGLMVENDRKHRKLHTNTEGFQQWQTQFKKEVFSKLLTDKETVCTGYAYIIQKLAHLAGLECEIVNGFGEYQGVKSNDLGIPNHSWNVIKLDGKWYLCDATWASGFTDPTTYLFEFDYDDSFFLMDPVEFAKSHHPLEKKWTLLPEK